MPVQLSVKVRNTQLVKKQFEDLTGEVKKIAEGRIYGRMEAARKLVTTQPPQYKDDPAHHWPEGEKGIRARRWYFANLAEGSINPPGEYERSGEYVDSWKIERTPNKDGWMLRSTFPAAKWLAGTATDPEMQYHIHKTRWPTLRGAVLQALTGLPKEIQENVSIVARRKGAGNG